MDTLRETVQAKTAVPTAQVYVSGVCVCVWGGGVGEGGRCVGVRRLVSEWIGEHRSLKQYHLSSILLVIIFAL